MTEGGEDAVQDEGTSRDFTFDLGETETVDIALALCENVTTDEDGNVSFTDTDNDGRADLGTVDDTTITSVNGVARAGATHVDNASATTDGDISVTIQHDGAGRECVVVVVFDDADDDDRLDVDADGLPTENFGVSGQTEFADVVALDATPETAVNRFGTEHTVTAELQDGAGDAVAQPGETVRFTVFRGGTEGTDGNGNAVCTGGSVVGTGSDTTDEDGQAAFTYTGPSDPDANSTGQSSSDCIQAFYDRDNDGVLDANEQSDVVTKTWQDESSVTTLDAEPEQDTNPVNTAHTVTATVTNEFGEPVSGAPVRFEVYRDTDNDDTADANPHNANRTTNASGVASFSYTGPANSDDDQIVVCRLETGETTCDDATTGLVGVGQTFATQEASANGEDDVDAVRKFWVEQASTTSDTAIAADSCVLAVDKDNNTIDVRDATTGDNTRFVYDGNDQYTVDGAPATMDQFETNVSEGDRIGGTYRPGGVSNFNLRNDTNCTLDGTDTTTG